MARTFFAGTGSGALGAGLELGKFVDEAAAMTEGRAADGWAEYVCGYAYPGTP